MAVISSFGTDSNIQDIDLLLGSDGNNNNVTKNFTVGGLKTYIANTIEIDNLTDENFYLTGVTAATDTGVITFSILGADNQTLDLGTSIFKDADYFATASHTHSLSDIVTANSITTTHLDVATTGDSGQILTSDGTGGFNWVNASSVTDTNNYLNGISKSGNTLTFTVSGDVADQPVTFGEAAFLSVNTIVNRVEENINLASITNGLGSLSKKSTVNSADIDANAIVASKITDGTITEPKLSVTNSPVSGYVLTSNGGDKFTWAENSASNYYLNNISKTNNTLTFEIAGGLDSDDYPEYTFGSAAFADIDTETGRTSSKVPPANHTHTVAHITDIGALGSLSNVNTSEILDSAVTAIKLSPEVGSSGQVLSVDGAGNLEWITISNSTTNFLSLPDTPASFGTAGQMLKVNTDADGLEFADFEVGASGIITTNTPTANKILAVDTNGTLEWIDQGGLANGSITPNKFNGINGNGEPGQIIQVDGDGTFSYTNQTVADGSITPIKLNGIADNGDAGQIIQTDGDGSFSYIGAPILVGESSSNQTIRGDLTFEDGELTISDGNLTVNGDTFPLFYSGGKFYSQITAVAADILISGAGKFKLANDTHWRIYGASAGLEIASSPSGSFPSTDTAITVSTDGDLQLNHYGSGSITGTPAQFLAVDSSGNVIEEDEDFVTYTMLADEFKTLATAVTLSSSTTTATCSFNSAAVFPITLASDATNTTITYSNATIGQTKILKVTGSGGTGTVTITGTNLSGTLDQTSSTVNYIQVTCIGSSEFIYTISQSA